MIKKAKASKDNIVKFPSKSVVVPLLVPFTRTVAPGRGPSSLVTSPETDWA